MNIVSIEIATAKCSFVIKTDIPKEIWILLQCTECPPIKLHSQSAIILSQFLYQIDDKDDIIRIVTFNEL